MIKHGKLNYIKLLVLVLLSVIIFKSTPAFAAECGNAKDTFFDWGCGSGDPITSMVITIFNWVTGGVSIVVVGGIIYGGILYMSSGGNQARAKQGMDVIRNAVIALIFFLGMFAIMNFLIPGGLFTS